MNTDLILDGNNQQVSNDGYTIDEYMEMVSDESAAAYNAIENANSTEWQSQEYVDLPTETLEDFSNNIDQATQEAFPDDPIDGENKVYRIYQLSDNQIIYGKAGASAESETEIDLADIYYLLSDLKEEQTQQNETANNYNDFIVGGIGALLGGACALALFAKIKLF